MENGSFFGPATSFQSGTTRASMVIRPWRPRHRHFLVQERATSPASEPSPHPCRRPAAARIVSAPTTQDLLWQGTASRLLSENPILRGRPLWLDRPGPFANRAVFP